jgi:hypothetical protein
MWYIIFKFRKYLEIGERKYIEICGTSYLNLENI